MEKIFKEIRKLQGDRETDLRIKDILFEMSLKLQEILSYFNNDDEVCRADPPQGDPDDQCCFEGMPDVNNES